jgi:hypothetical protein
VLGLLPLPRERQPTSFALHLRLPVHNSAPLVPMDSLAEQETLRFAFAKRRGEAEDSVSTAGSSLTIMMSVSKGHRSNEWITDNSLLSMFVHLSTCERWTDQGPATDISLVIECSLVEYGIVCCG